MKRTVIYLALLLRCTSGICQQDGIREAILLLSGASTEEELAEDVEERFEVLQRHPLRINSAPIGRLTSCGLFTRYQAASIADYRQRTGDILSFSELGMIDGIGAEMAEALKCFVSLERSVSDDGTTGCSILTRCAGRMDRGSSPQTCAGAKLHWYYGERMELNWAGRTTYAMQSATPGTFSAALYGSRGKIILGDYNARFGQGLGLWNGFSLNGFSSAASFRKNGTGISATNSWSGGFRGLAGEMNHGAWTASGALSFQGLRSVMDGGSGTVSLMPQFNISRLGKSCSAGMTAWCDFTGNSPDWCVAIDGKAGMGHVELFGEAAMQKNAVTGGIIGAVCAPEYGSRLCLMARYYPPAFNSGMSNAAGTSSTGKDETGISAGWFGKALSMSADASWKPEKGSHAVKVIAAAAPQFGLGAFRIKPELRISSRYKPEDGQAFRNEMRVSLSAIGEPLSAAGRVSAVRCADWGLHAYLEGGFRNAGSRSVISVFLRGSLFKVDNWDDRIYVYERDVPGSFNVPAFYGRGWSASLVGGWKRNGRNATHCINARLAYTDYPWTPGKEARGEIKLQYSLQFRYRLFHFDSAGPLHKDKGSGNPGSGKMGGEGRRIREPAEHQ